MSAAPDLGSGHSQSQSVGQSHIRLCCRQSPFILAALMHWAPEPSRKVISALHLLLLVAAVYRRLIIPILSVSAIDSSSLTIRLAAKPRQSDSARSDPLFARLAMTRKRFPSLSAALDLRAASLIVKEPTDKRDYTERNLLVKQNSLDRRIIFCYSQIHGEWRGIADNKRGGADEGHIAAGVTRSDCGGPDSSHRGNY